MAPICCFYSFSGSERVVGWSKCSSGALECVEWLVSWLAWEGILVNPFQLHSNNVTIVTGEGEGWG